MGLKKKIMKWLLPSPHIRLLEGKMGGRREEEFGT